MRRVRRWLEKRSQAAHPELVPLACLLMGHLGHNDLTRRRVGGYYLAGNPCVRSGCPGEDHVWSSSLTSLSWCTVPGCTWFRSPVRPPAGPGFGAGPYHA